MAQERLPIDTWWRTCGSVCERSRRAGRRGGSFALYVVAFVLLVAAGVALVASAKGLLESTRLLWVSTALSAAAIVVAVVGAVRPAAPMTRRGGGLAAWRRRASPLATGRVHASRSARPPTPRRIRRRRRCPPARGFGRGRSMAALCEAPKTGQRLGRHARRARRRRRSRPWRSRSSRSAGCELHVARGGHAARRQEQIDRRLDEELRQDVPGRLLRPPVRRPGARSA